MCTEESASTPSNSRPTSAKRAHRHSSSGNVMLDQLLKDLGNKLTVAEDVCVWGGGGGGGNCLFACTYLHLLTL